MQWRTDQRLWPEHLALTCQPLHRNGHDLAVDLAVDLSTPGARGRVGRHQVRPRPLELRRDQQVGLYVPAQMLDQPFGFRIRRRTEIRAEPNVIGEWDVF